ncbi:efflux RND transporter periplasmic adaptor subunit [Pontibacillus salicampi]|uniref:Efflux RND transporter periplasmic adaptor subunit n=1 Tax=Pontibacillus salicampi TaxID=1449801 RepID=A0ABV6LSI1_9BACI
MKKIGIYMVMLWTVLVISACSNDQTSDEPEEEQVTPVKIAKVSKGDLQIEKEVYGRAMPGAQSGIIPKANGELVELTIEKGDVVKKGQTIGRIDTGNSQDNVRLQEIAVESAQKQLDQAVSQREAAEENLANAREQLDDAKSAQNASKGGSTGSVEDLESLLSNARQNEERMQELVESGAVKKEELTRVQSQVEELTKQLSQAQQQNQQAQAAAGQSAVAQAEMAVTQAEQQLDSAKIGVEQAALQVDQAQVQLEQAKGQLQNGAITSNQAGEVVSLEAKEGDMVSNTQPMATVVSLNPIKVEATVSPEELQLFEKGKEVPVAISSVQDDFKAKVNYISPVTNDTGLYPVEATIANSDKVIKPGMMVTFQLPEVTVKDKLLVPTSAVLEENGESFVYVIAEEKAKKTPVEVIRAQSNTTAVKGELSKGDQVVIKGQLTLSDNNKVSIVKEDN